jgi:hypothetical protein
MAKKGPENLNTLARLRGSIFSDWFTKYWSKVELLGFRWPFGAPVKRKNDPVN